MKNNPAKNSMKTGAHPRGSGKSGIAKPHLSGSAKTQGSLPVHGGLLKSGPTHHPAHVANHGMGHDGRSKHHK